MSIVRLRRLQADHLQLNEFVRTHPRLQLLQADGDPPERYQIEYCIKSLRQVGADLSEVKSHLVEISLPRNYPRVPPACRMLTPVFHPNIAPHAICIGDHWNAGEPLISIVARIGEMLAYQSYNVKSPLNGEAARWVDLHAEELPLDSVSMAYEMAVVPATAPVSPSRSRPAESGDIPFQKDSPWIADAPPVENFWIEDPPSPPPPPADIRFACTNCGARMKASAHKAGQQGHCPKCQSVVLVPRQ